MRRLFSLGVAGFAAILLAFGVAAVSGSGAQSATTPYTQVVDNTAQGRFSAPGWSTSSYGTARLGSDYRYVEPKSVKKPATYRLKIPTTARYSVFALTPSNSGYNAAASFGVTTTSGVRWTTVNQRTGGGQWKKLGVYKLQAGDRNVVKVSPSSESRGYVIADGIKVVRGDVAGTQSAPPSSGTSGGGTTGGNTESGTSPAAVTGADVLKEAKTWLGVPYRYGGTSKSGVDCSGLTYSIYQKLGISIPRVAADQYNGGPGVKVGNRDFQRGYLVFGNTGGSGIQHVGIITGSGTMIHAPVPGSVVREDQMPSNWYNVIGIKKIVPAA